MAHLSYQIIKNENWVITKNAVLAKDRARIIRILIT